MKLGTAMLREPVALPPKSSAVIKAQASIQCGPKCVKFIQAARKGENPWIQGWNTFIRLQVDDFVTAFTIPIIEIMGHNTGRRQHFYKPWRSICDLTDKQLVNSGSSSSGWYDGKDGENPKLRCLTTGADGNDYRLIVKVIDAIGLPDTDK